MPTAKPRISITLEDSEIAILDRFALASGAPRASVVSDLVRFSLPNLAEAAELMELAKAAPRKLQQHIVDQLDNATLDAMGALQEHKKKAEHIFQTLQAELQFPEKKRPGLGRSRGHVRDARKGSGDPHLLTGGSKL
jgi:hypothetical protein